MTTLVLISINAADNISHHLLIKSGGNRAKQIGAIAKPDQIRFTDVVPKTRSGKIMRRLLRELAGSGEVKGDISTLEDFSVLARLRKDEES